MDRTSCGEDVVTFRFSKPPGYSFVPGQYFSLHLETEDGPASKPFSHAAAPADDWIEVTTHLSGSVYKRALESLGAGDMVEATAATGRFVLPADSREVCFLVGGVGITPARSILRDAIERETGLRALLFYGNRSADCVPYRGELDTYGPMGVETIHVFEYPPAGWGGASGTIRPDIVEEHEHDLADPLFAVAGPPAMVGAMESVLEALEVPEDRRLVERFGQG